MVNVPVLNQKFLAVPKVIDEGFIKFRFTEQIAVELYFDMMIL